MQGAEMHEVGTSLAKILDENQSSIGYIAIRGIVKPLGAPLYSINDKHITGVIQKLSIKEHVVARTSAGFWSDQEHTVQKVYNIVPFVLRQGPHRVEIVDPLSADILDMAVVSDSFKPSVPTLIDHLWSFLTGVRQRGLQSTEEILREGAVMTGIGELSKSATEPNTFILQPPLSGAPFYLTSMSITSLIRKLEGHKRVYRLLCLMFGTIGLAIAGIIVRRYWKSREAERLAEELKQSLAQSRKERRQRVRDKDLREDQLCVVCRTNAREIILLPCGHVCLCENCSNDINVDCPVCRTTIQQKAPAYII